MNSRHLFLKRFKAESRFHYENFIWVFPKLYWFYILGPYAIFGVAFYRELWNYPEQYFPSYFPKALLVGGAMLFLSFGTFRSYLFEADLLYLLQNKKLLRGMRLYGFISSLFVSLVQVFIVMVVFLPFLRAGSSMIEAGLLSGLLWGYKVSGMLIRSRYGHHWSGRFFGVILFLGTVLIFTLGPVIYISLALVMVLATLFVYVQKLESNERFYQEIAVEWKEKYKFVSFIFFASQFRMDEVPEITKSPLSKSPAPDFLFPKSRRIFKKRNLKNSFLEFSLKSFIRNPSYRFSYLRLLTTPAILAIVLPSIVQLILYVVMICAIGVFASGVFEEIGNHEFFQLVSVNKEIREKVEYRFIICLILPAVVVTTFYILLL